MTFSHGLFEKRSVLVMASLVVAMIVSTKECIAQQPWEEPSDPEMAINSPDTYAWKLFVALNWPARPKSCEPDTSKQLGDSAEGPVVWESWGSRLELYPRFFANPSDEPQAWEDICANRVSDKTLVASSQLQALAALADSSGNTSMFTSPGNDASSAADEEVRLNKHAFRFIRDNKLYRRATLNQLAEERQKRLAAGLPAPIDTFIQFPVMGKEVKAHWVRLDQRGQERLEQDKKRYHWATREKDGAVFGLVALHITTKDLPNWFWATWEHVDAEERLPVEWNQIPGNRVFASWIVRSVDRLACPEAPYDCNKIPTGLGLEGTKWENYRLRATQTNFVDSKGKATIVVNSKIESGFDQETSSCMSCHALATADRTSSSFPLGLTPGGNGSNGYALNFNGIEMLERFKTAGDDVIQMDFVWSLRNAN